MRYVVPGPFPALCSFSAVSPMIISLFFVCSYLQVVAHMLAFTNEGSDKHVLLSIL